MEFVIGLVAMWAIAKARRVAVRADGVVDQALDAAVDRVGELVTSRLAGDSAVAQLEAEAADNGEVSARTRQRVQLAVEDAVEKSPEFGRELEAAVAAATTMTGRQHATDQALVIGSVGTFVQAPTAGVVPVVHAIEPDQPVSPGVGFVGRDAETERLLADIAPGEDAGPVVVSAVAGMGGIGKTALARFCAAEAMKQGLFPGGAYVVDMRGYSPGGMVSGSSVFEPLLYRLGAENVPGEPTAQAAVYVQTLRMLARQGRRVLLVLDNASTAAQVEGLLPTAGGHRVVITTRDTLAIPGARRLSLDVLTETDAVAMLDRALREQDPNDGRAADDGAVLVGVCGLLPLAVRIAAGLLADEPDMFCAELSTGLPTVILRPRGCWDCCRSTPAPTSPPKLPQR